jgi:hypothetical protein
MEASLPQLILSIKMERSEEGLASLGGLGVMEEMARALRVWQRVDEQLAGRGSGRGCRQSGGNRPQMASMNLETSAENSRGPPRKRLGAS